MKSYAYKMSKRREGLLKNNIIQNNVLMTMISKKYHKKQYMHDTGARIFP